MSDDKKRKEREVHNAEQVITVTCQNCEEEITNSRGMLKRRDWECPYCGGRILEAGED